VLQRAKSLPHLMEFAQRRVEPTWMRPICGFLLRNAPAAATVVQGERNGRYDTDGKRSEGASGYGQLTAIRGTVR